MRRSPDASVSWVSHSLSRLIANFIDSAYRITFQFNLRHANPLLLHVYLHELALFWLCLRRQKPTEPSCCFRNKARRGWATSGGFFRQLDFVIVSALIPCYLSLSLSLIPFTPHAPRLHVL